MRILWLVNKDNLNHIKFGVLFNSNYHQVITCKSDYNKTERDNFKDIDALVVQINLGWASKDTFDGIRLVQELRLSDSVNIPIVFLSLSLPREEILFLNPSLDIISTFGLGNGFCFKNGDNINFALPMDIDEIPTSMDNYIKLLPKIDDIRRLDIKYFCRKEDQIRGLRREMNYLSDLEQVKKKLMKLSENDPRVSEATTREKLCELCNILINESKDNNKVKKIRENRTKVLLLDDKYDEDEGIKFFLEYSTKMLDIKCCKTVKEALNIVKNFNPNIVLVDLRLQDCTEYPIINKQQGYDYLNIHKESYPHIGIIVLSRLPMPFLKDLSKSMSNFRTFYWKKELKEKAYCDMLIQNITKLFIIEFVSESPQNERFTELYNWWYFEKNSSSEQLSPSEEQHSIIPNITREEHVDKRTKEIIEVIKSGNAIRNNGKGMEVDGVFKENRLQRKFQKNYALSDLFIFRRVAIYLYYHFEKKSQCDKWVYDNDKKKLFEKKEINLYINHILAYHSDYDINCENNGITTRYLFLKAKNKRIRSFKDIALTNKEKSFFYNYYPEFFNEWNQKH